MTSLEMSLVGSAVPVTMVMAAGLVLERWAARRRPAAGSFVAAATLGLVVSTTALALVPRAGWWAWPWPVIGAAGQPAPDAGLGSTRTSEGTRARPSARAEQGGLAWSRAYVRALEAWLEAAGSSRSSAGAGAAGGLRLAVLGAIGLSFGRLFLGLWAVRGCRIRSQRIDDPHVGGLVDELRAAMGCGREVELRESSELTGAATVGWRRPVVLLPVEWRTWSKTELRAVLAHELAHVRGGDYRAGLVARSSVALHVYHPLAHWLAARLRLEQELAADALGARVGGGREAYLRVLSRMAIRQEEQALGPARMFLAGRGTLIRRIEMLRDPRGSNEAELGRRGRAVLAVPLVVVALAAGGLRGPDRPARAGEPGGERRGPDASRWDFSYIPADVQAVAAVRPAAAFRHPGMSPHAGTLRAMLDRVFPGSPVRIEQIEQVAVGMSVQPIGPVKDAHVSKRLIMNGFMARSTVPVDWKVEVERLLKVAGEGRMEEATHRDSVYYKIVDAPKYGTDLSVYFPDGRTIVCYPGGIIRAMIDGSGRGGPAFARDRDGKATDGDLVTYIVDNRRGQFTPSRPAYDTPEELAAIDLIEKANRITIGVRDADTLALRVIAEGSSPGAGAAIARAGEELRKQNLEESADRLSERHPDWTPGHLAGIRIARRLWEQLRIKAGEQSAEFQAETEIGLPEVAEALIAGGLF